MITKKKSRNNDRLTNFVLNYTNHSTVIYKKIEKLISR
ncbi:hypothetical protein LEP1GSC035_4840 [Leptospira noguchii str. 2007001578]|uniref:Uncharacterized protein n=2 Tax=Leptospira noguchii TaxID=28182 RepID=M6Y8G6_9LEPT|nr:hypothetical protein LEP1GSC035_4840 [Leptospira noguchii str. 2007001578]EMO90015.1 hypothetical protein LEP1GSC024_2773 [Leptospira noguchii str. 2001034031]